MVDGCVNMTSLQCWMVDHCRLWPSQWWETSSCLDLIYPPSNLRRLITDLQKLSANEKRLIEREREREGFQAVFHWMDLKGSLSLIKQSPALWFVWLSVCMSAFLQETACLAPCLHPSLKNIWCYVPAFMFLRVIVSSTWLDAEKQNTRWRWTHTKMQGELSLPGPRALGDIRKGCYAQLCVSSWPFEKSATSRSHKPGNFLIFLLAVQ